MIFRRSRLIPLRLLASAMGLSVVVLAGVARVDMGVHWPSDVLGGLLLGSAALGGLLLGSARPLEDFSGCTFG